MVGDDFLFFDRPTVKIIQRTMRRHLLWVIPMGLLICGGIFFAAERFQVQTFRASHWVEVAPNYVAFSDVRSKKKNAVQAEQKLIMSQLVLEPVLVQPAFVRLAADGDEILDRKFLEKNLKLESAGEDGRYIISFDCSDPACNP